MAVKFDLESLASQSVTHAEFSMYQYYDDMDFLQVETNSGNSGFNPVDLRLCPIVKPWDTADIDFGDVSQGDYSFTTYSNRSQWPEIDTVNPSVFTYDGNSSNSWHTWDVTTQINAMLAGAPNYGFMIYGDLPQDYYEFGTLLGNWYASSNNTELDNQYRPKLTLTLGNTAVAASHIPAGAFAPEVSLQGRTLQLQGLSSLCRELQLLTLSGRTVLKTALSGQEHEGLPLPAELRSGVYIVRIIGEQGSIDRRVTLF